MSTISNVLEIAFGRSILLFEKTIVQNKLISHTNASKHFSIKAQIEHIKIQKVSETKN